MSEIVFEIANTEVIKDQIEDVILAETWVNMDNEIRGVDDAADEILKLFLRLLGVEVEE